VLAPQVHVEVGALRNNYQRMQHFSWWSR
jgi:hypothetical protein